jgi:deoxyribose-phosphate aldolase
LAPRRSRTLISEASLAGLAEGSVLEVVEPFLITPAAASLARQRQIAIRPVASAAPGEQRGRSIGTQNLAGRIESTRLDTTVTTGAVEALCAEARREGFAGVCIAPAWVARAASLLAGSDVSVVTVASFPLGTSRPEIKAAEAGLAAHDGAHEVDMVMAVGPLLAGDWQAVRDDVAAVRRVLDGPGLILKVIIEAPLLTPEQIVQAAILAVDGGADYVKTGTGFRGPAKVEQVRLIRRTVGERARIKAAGGIRTAEAARELVAAGADRLGTSAALALVRPSSARA